MRDFSLDLQAERIYSAKTKEYFEEVIKSYYSESYRSAIVMLYSIVVTDLIYKIEELRDVYNDDNAIAIIDEITTLQTDNPKSAEWEKKLIHLVKEKTSLLEPADHLHVTTLQQHRHLCAHPVLTQNFDLYRPNRETTRAHIRNMLEGVLTKPALLSKKILDDFLQNLASVKTVIHDEGQLEQHIKSRYLDKVNQKTIHHLFRSLWKITFKLSDTLCERNRNINLKALTIIVRNNYADLIDLISTERNYYSDVSVEYLSTFITFLNQFSSFFEKLDDSLKILASNTIQKDADLDTIAIFLSKDIEQHIEKVLEIGWNSGYERDYISTDSILQVFKHCLAEGKRDLAYTFLIGMFGRSGEYRIADSRFDNLIKPYLDNFSKKEIKKVLFEINRNTQIYDRYKAPSTNNYVKQRVLELFGGSFDFEPYFNFRT